MAAFRRLSFRILALSASFFLCAITTSFSLSGQCRCCDHDRHGNNHHESKLADAGSTPRTQHATNCLNFCVPTGSDCNEEILWEAQAASSVANVVPADCAQDNLQAGSFDSVILPVYLIKKNLRL